MDYSEKLSNLLKNLNDTTRQYYKQNTNKETSDEKNLLSNENKASLKKDELKADDLYGGMTPHTEENAEENNLKESTKASANNDAEENSQQNAEKSTQQAQLANLNNLLKNLKTNTQANNATNKQEQVVEDQNKQTNTGEKPQLHNEKPGQQTQLSNLNSLLKNLKTNLTYNFNNQSIKTSTNNLKNSTTNNNTNSDNTQTSSNLSQLPNNINIKNLNIYSAQVSSAAKNFTDKTNEVQEEKQENISMQEVNLQPEEVEEEQLAQKNVEEKQIEEKSAEDKKALNETQDGENKLEEEQQDEKTSTDDSQKKDDTLEKQTKGVSLSKSMLRFASAAPQNAESDNNEDSDSSKGQNEGENDQNPDENQKQKDNSEVYDSENENLTDGEEDVSIDNTEENNTSANIGPNSENINFSEPVIAEAVSIEPVLAKPVMAEPVIAEPIIAEAVEMPRQVLSASAPIAPTITGNVVTNPDGTKVETIITTQGSVQLSEETIEYDANGKIISRAIEYNEEKARKTNPVEWFVTVDSKLVGYNKLKEVTTYDEDGNEVDFYRLAVVVAPSDRDDIGTVRKLDKDWNEINTTLFVDEVEQKTSVKEDETLTLNREVEQERSVNNINLIPNYTLTNGELYLDGEKVDVSIKYYDVWDPRLAINNEFADNVVINGVYYTDGYPLITNGLCFFIGQYFNSVEEIENATYQHIDANGLINGIKFENSWPTYTYNDGKFYEGSKLLNGKYNIVEKELAPSYPKLYEVTESETGLMYKDGKLANENINGVEYKNGYPVTEEPVLEPTVKEYNENGVKFTVTENSEDATFSYRFEGDTLYIESAKDCVIDINENSNSYLNIQISQDSEHITLNAKVRIDLVNNANDVVINGSYADDNIVNMGENVTINAGEGNDSIINWSSDATISGGVGDDYIINEDDGSNVIIDGGAGDDYIENYGGHTTINGGEGNDNINNYGANTIIDGYDENGYDVNGYDRLGYNKDGYDKDGNLRPANTLLKNADGSYSAKWYENGIKAYEEIKNNETCTEISWNEAGVKTRECIYSSYYSPIHMTYWNDSGVKISEGIFNPDGSQSTTHWNDDGVKIDESVINSNGEKEYEYLIDEDGLFLDDYNFSDDEHSINEGAAGATITRTYSFGDKAEYIVTTNGITISSYWNSKGIKISEYISYPDGTWVNRTFNDSGIKTYEDIANLDHSFVLTLWNEKGIKTGECITNDNFRKETSWNDDGIKTVEHITKPDGSLIKRTEWNDEGTTEWTINSDGYEQRTIRDKDGDIVSECIYNYDGSSTETFYNKDKIKTFQKITDIYGSCTERFFDEAGIPLEGKIDGILYENGIKTNPNKMGIDENDIISNTYDDDGFDSLGWSLDGINQETGEKWNTQGYDKNGYFYDIEKGELANGRYEDLGKIYKDGEEVYYDEKGIDLNNYDSQGRKYFDGELANGRYENLHKIYKDGFVVEYDENGYDIDGYNRIGLNAAGFDRNGVHYDVNVEDYNENGLDKDGFQINGYDLDGYDRYGWNEKGWNREGINKETGTLYDLSGLDVEGYDKDGWKLDDIDYINKETGDVYDIDGYNRWGEDRYGFYRGEEYNWNGVNRDGFNSDGLFCAPPSDYENYNWGGPFTGTYNGKIYEAGVEIGTLPPHTLSEEYADYTGIYEENGLMYEKGSLLTGISSVDNKIYKDGTVSENPAEVLINLDSQHAVFVGTFDASKVSNVKYDEYGRPTYIRGKSRLYTYDEWQTYNISYDENNNVTITRENSYNEKYKVTFNSKGEIIYNYKEYCAKSEKTIDPDTGKTTQLYYEKWAGRYDETVLFTISYKGNYLKDYYLGHSNDSASITLDNGMTFNFGRGDTADFREDGSYEITYNNGKNLKYNANTETLLVNDELANGNVNNYLYKEGLLDKENQVASDGKLYIDGKIAKGYNLFNDTLYSNEKISKGKVVYNGKLYENGYLSEELSEYNNQLYSDGEKVVGEDMNFNNKFYHNGVAYTGVINGKYYINGLPLNGEYYTHKDNEGNLLGVSIEEYDYYHQDAITSLDTYSYGYVITQEDAQKMVEERQDYYVDPPSSYTDYKPSLWDIGDEYSNFMNVDPNAEIKNKKYDDFGNLISYTAYNLEYETDFDYNIEYSDYGYSITAKPTDSEDDYNRSYTVEYCNYYIYKTVTENSDIRITKTNGELSYTDEYGWVFNESKKYTEVKSKNGTYIKCYCEDINFSGTYMSSKNIHKGFYNGEQVVIDKQGNYKVTDKNGNISVYDINGNKYEGFFGVERLDFSWATGRIFYRDINGQEYNNLLEKEDLEYYIDGKPANASTTIDGKIVYFKDGKLLNGAFEYDGEMIYCQKGLKATGHIDNSDGTKTYFVDGLLANGIVEGVLCINGSPINGLIVNPYNDFINLFAKDTNVSFEDVLNLYNTTQDEDVKEILSYFVSENKKETLFWQSLNRKNLKGILSVIGTTDINTQTLDETMKRLCLCKLVNGNDYRKRENQVFLKLGELDSYSNKEKEYLSNYITSYVEGNGYYVKRGDAVLPASVDKIINYDIKTDTISLMNKEYSCQLMYKDGVFADDVFVGDTLYYSGQPAVGYNIHDDKLYKESSLYTGEFYDPEERKEATYKMGEKLNGEYVVIKENNAIVEIREPQEGEEGLLYKDGVIANNELVNEILYKNGRVAKGYNVYNEQMFYDGTRYTGKHGATYLNGDELNGKYVVEYDEETKQVTSIREPEEGEDCLLYKDGYLVNNEIVDGKLYVDGKVAQGMTYDYGLAYYNGELANGNIFDIFYKDGLQLNGYYTVEEEDNDTLAINESDEANINSKLYLDGKVVDKQIIDNIYYEDGRIAKGYDLIEDTMYFNGRAYTGEASDDGIYIYGKAINGYYVVTKDEDDDVESIKISDAENGTYYKDGKISDPVETVISIKDDVEFKDGIWTDNVIVNGITVDGVVAYGYLYVNGQMGGTAVVNDRHYVDGKLAIGDTQVDGIKYYNGRKLNGFVDNKYYADGVLANGTYLGVFFVEGDFYTGEKDGVQYIDGYVADGYYDDTLWIDGHLANGEVDGVIYEGGSPINKLRNGKMYIDGVLANGVASDGRYYQNGSLSDGVDEDGIVYVAGNKANKVIDGILYINGQPFTGSQVGRMYKDGVLANGVVNGVLYENGYISKVNEITIDGILYKNGYAYNGTIDNKLYVNGMLANGTVGDKFYVNGVESAKPAIQENYVNSNGLYIISYPDFSTLNIPKENITYTENDDGTIMKTYEFPSEDFSTGRTISQTFDENGIILSTSVDDYNYDMTTGMSSYYTTTFDENNKCNFRFTAITEMQPDGKMKMTMVTDPDGTLTKVEKSSEVIELTASETDVSYSARTNEGYAAQSVIETSLSKIKLARWTYNTDLLGSDPDYQLSKNYNNGGEIINYLDDAYSFIDHIRGIVWDSSSNVSFSQNNITISTENTDYEICFDNKNQITSIKSTKHTEYYDEKYDIKLTYDSTGNVSSMSYKKKYNNNDSSNPTERETLFTAILKNSVVQRATLDETQENKFKNNSSHGTNSNSKHIEIDANMNITNYETEDFYAKYWNDGDIYTWSRDNSLNGNVLTEKYKVYDKNQYSTYTTNETYHYSVSPSAFYVSAKTVNGKTKSFPQKVLTDETRVDEYHYRQNDSYTNYTKTVVRTRKKDESYKEKITFNETYGNNNHNTHYEYETVYDGYDSYSDTSSSNTTYSDGDTHNHNTSRFENHVSGQGSYSYDCHWSTKSGNYSDSDSWSYDTYKKTYEAPEVPVTSVPKVDTTKLYKNPEVQYIKEDLSLREFPAAMRPDQRGKEATEILNYYIQQNKNLLNTSTFNKDTQEYLVETTIWGMPYKFRVSRDGIVLPYSDYGTWDLLGLRRWLSENDANSSYADGKIGTAVQYKGDCNVLAPIFEKYGKNVSQFISKTNNGYKVTLPGDLTNQKSGTIIQSGAITVELSYEKLYEYYHNYSSKGDMDVFILECAINELIGNGTNVEAYNLLNSSENKKVFSLSNLPVEFGISNSAYDKANSKNWFAEILGLCSLSYGAIGGYLANTINNKILKQGKDWKSTEVRMAFLNSFLPYLKGTICGTCRLGQLDIKEDVIKKYNVVLPSDNKGDSTIVKWVNPGENDMYTHLNLEHAYNILDISGDYIIVVNPHYPNTKIKVPKEIFASVMNIQIGVNTN